MHALAAVEEALRKEDAAFSWEAGSILVNLIIRSPLSAKKAVYPLRILETKGKLVLGEVWLPPIAGRRIVGVFELCDILNELLRPVRLGFDVSKRQFCLSGLISSDPEDLGNKLDRFHYACRVAHPICHTIGLRGDWILVLDGLISLATRPTSDFVLDRAH
jgi:hypothetical protein